MKKFFYRLLLLLAGVLCLGSMDIFIVFNIDGYVAMDNLSFVVNAIAFTLLALSVIVFIFAIRLRNSITIDNLMREMNTQNLGVNMPRVVEKRSALSELISKLVSKFRSPQLQH